MRVRDLLVVSSIPRVPSVVQQFRTISSSNNNTFGFARPAASGNLMVLIASSVQNRSVSTPSGWTPVYSPVTAPNFAVFTKIASNEANSYAVNFSVGGINAAIYALEITGQKPNNPLIKLGDTFGSNSPEDVGGANLPVAQHSLVIGSIILSSSSNASGISISNSPTVESPASPSSIYHKGFYKVYTSAAAAETFTASWTNAANAATVLFQVT